MSLLQGNSLALQMAGKELHWARRSVLPYQKAEPGVCTEWESVEGKATKQTAREN